MSTAQEQRDALAADVQAEVLGVSPNGVPLNGELLARLAALEIRFRKLEQEVIGLRKIQDTIAEGHTPAPLHNISRLPRVEVAKGKAA